MLFQSTKETMDKREIFDEESRECRRKIDELEGLLATQQAAAQRQITRLLAEIDDLNVQLSDTKSVQANAVKEWDVECAELEEEIYELIGKRKTEGKKLRTMQRKNTWLTASIRRLSEQRREELAAKKDEILKLNSLCELQRMEKVEWLSDLKKDVNAWKNETSVRIELKQKITDLEEQNEGLEEKVENVLAQYRSECELYQNSVSSLQMDRDRLRKDVDLYKGKAEILFTKFGDLVKTNDELEKKAHQKMLEADNLRKTVEFSNMEMTNVKALMAMEREQILEERHSTVRDLEEKLKNLTMTSSINKNLLAEARRSIARLTEDAKEQSEAQEFDRLRWNDQVDQLKEVNEELKKNLGVEVLESSDDSDCSSDSSSDSDCSSDSSDSEEDEEYRDMPKLKDETTAENSWELVGEEEEEAEQQQNN